MTRRRTLTLIVALFLATVAGVGAQAQPVRKVRGTIASVTADQVTVTARDGSTVTAALPATAKVAQVVPIDIAAIQPNSFIGTATTGPDSAMVALEVLVFPEAARGTGEGHYAWDLLPDSMMTNATVADVATQPSGRVLTLALKGARFTVTVPPGAPVVTITPGERSMLVSGAKVFMIVRAGTDGAPTVDRILVGKDGLAPPM